jgi:hypothetical protein
MKKKESAHEPAEKDVAPVDWLCEHAPSGSPQAVVSATSPEEALQKYFGIMGILSSAYPGTVTLVEPPPP